MILAGGGLAGRSLAYFLSSHPGLGDVRILLVDDSRHYQHRSIVYWYDGALPLPLTPSASCTTLAVDTLGGLRTLSLPAPPPLPVTPVHVQPPVEPCRALVLPPVVLQLPQW